MAGVALVAGAGPGIGSAVVRKLAAQNYRVCAARRNGDKLDSLVGELQEKGLWCQGFGCDFRKEDEVRDLVERVESDHGPITVAVHNIGANIGVVPIAQTTARQFSKIWEMAAFSAFLFGKEVGCRMEARQSGTLIFTGATASMRGGSGFAAFSSAKMAKRALAQSMARELGPRGVHVAHVVIDGAVNTEPTRQFFASKSAAFGERFDELSKAEGLLDPAGVAEAYYQLILQPKSVWTHELDLRPWVEKW